MPLPEILGFGAAFCTTVAFLPQVIMVLKTWDTSSLSLATFGILVLGLIQWLIYGVYRDDIIIIAANAVTLILASIILAVKIYNEFFKSEPNRASEKS